MNYIKQYKKVKDKKIRKQLIKNYGDGEDVVKYPDLCANKLSLSIANGFQWIKTKQGGSYWYIIFDLADREKLELRKGKKYKKVKK